MRAGVPARESVVSMLAAALCVILPGTGRAQLLTRSVSRPDFVKATETAVDGRDFGKHLDYVENLLLEAVKSLQVLSGVSGYDRVLADEVMSVALVQSAVIRHATPAKLAGFAGSGTDAPAFLKWLFCDREAMESYLTTVKPEDDPAKVLDLWCSLWAKDPEGRATHANLALACAVVFDQPLKMDRRLNPNGTVDMKERYAFFRKADAQGRLRTELKRLPAWELVWVVDAPVPDSELAWAQERVNLQRNAWVKAYEMVPYRMDKVTQGAQIHEKYTLAEILEKGGVCTDRAYFASVTAKANGIPAIPLSGEGQRGGHAWFAFKASLREWNMSGGRYESDRYATGYTTDPQTRRRIKEQMLSFLADEQRRSPNYDKASRLAWLAGVYAARGQTAQSGAALEAAIGISTRHVAAWESYLKYLKQAATPKEKWKNVLLILRRDFGDYPDMIARADQLETEVLLDATKVDDILKSLQAQSRKLEANSNERTDLILETIQRHIKLLGEGGNTNAVETVYEKSLREFGGEIGVYRALAKAYFAFAQKNKTTKKALDSIESVYRRHYSAPTMDYFAISTQVSLMNMIADFYKADGNQKESDALRKKAEVLKARSQATHRWN